MSYRLLYNYACHPTPWHATVAKPSVCFGHTLCSDSSVDRRYDNTGLLVENCLSFISSNDPWMSPYCRWLWLIWWRIHLLFIYYFMQNVFTILIKSFSNGNNSVWSCLASWSPSVRNPCPWLLGGGGAGDRFCFVVVDWEHLLCETRAPLGIMGDQLRASFKPLNEIVLW